MMGWLKDGHRRKASYSLSSQQIPTFNSPLFGRFSLHFEEDFQEVQVATGATSERRGFAMLLP